MKTYFSNLIPQLLSYSKKLDSSSLLTGQHWTVIDENLNEKTVFIFRAQNNELLISRNGKVEKGTWDLIDHNTLLIDTKTESRMFKHGFADDCVLALKVDGKTEYAFMVNENKISESVTSIEQVGRYLEMKYVFKRDEILEAVKSQVVQPKEIVDSYSNEEDKTTDFKDEGKRDSVAHFFIFVVIIVVWVYFSTTW